MNFRKGSSAHAIACFVSVGLLLFLLAGCGGGEQQVVRRPPPDTLTLVSKSSLFPPGCDNVNPDRTNYENGEVEPWVAIDPTDSSHVWLASINRIVGITAQPTD